jgi:MFS family permease
MGRISAKASYVGTAMTQRERQGWLIVLSLFFTLLLIFGSGYNTVPVFVPSLLKAFPNRSRAQVSLLPSMLALSAGVSVVPAGWLLDRVEARIVMIVGALASGGAFLIASRLNSLSPMIGAYLLLGIGISAGTVLPAALVVANWFEARRGLAMGIALSGTTVGGMVMTLVASHIIRGWGWRAAYIALGAPMILVVVPLVALVVRSRPPGTVKMTVAQGAETLEGFEASEALRTRSFWMIVVAKFCFGLAAAGAVIHLVAYLEGIGYTGQSAAFTMSHLRLRRARKSSHGISGRPGERAYRTRAGLRDDCNRSHISLRRRARCGHRGIRRGVRNPRRGAADSLASAGGRVTRAQALRVP